MTSNYKMINKPYWNLLFVFVLFFSCREVNSQSIPKWKITDLEEYIAKSDTPVIVNFWATYCVPCIKEIPYFQEVVKQYEEKGVKLLLVSLYFRESFPYKISTFAGKRKFTSPIVWLDETDADYFCPKVGSTRSLGRTQADAYFFSYYDDLYCCFDIP